MWFQSFQNSCTVVNCATLCVLSAYDADFSLDCIICSHITQVYRKGKSFDNISSFSSELSVVNLRFELKFSLKLKNAIPARCWAWEGAEAVPSCSNCTRG